MQFAIEEGQVGDRPTASFFMRALLEGLATGEADGNPPDGQITIDELVGFLVRKLQLLGSPQRPTKWTFGASGGDMVFVNNPRSQFESFTI